MKMYTCCPVEGCGGFQKALKWLKSWGIEPALQQDDESHYFEFDVPDDWDTEKRIAFHWELCRQTSGNVICRCGLWLDDSINAPVIEAMCRVCGRRYLFCSKCKPLDEWGGCDCEAGMTVGELRDLLNKYIEEDGLPLDSSVETMLWNTDDEIEGGYAVTMVSCHVSDKVLYIDAFVGE